MIKISFASDIACDRPMLNAAKKSETQYDFSGMLSGLASLFHDSDFVVGNLETVFAGMGVPYNKGVRYNTPDTLLDEIKASGFNVLTTANNHCFDGGLSGLKRTLDLLNKQKILHTGTYCEKAENRHIVLSHGATKVALLSYTYSINCYDDFKYPENMDDYINLLRGFESIEGSRNIFKKIFKKLTSYRIRRLIKILLRMPTISVYQDTFANNPVQKEYLENIKTEIAAAKREADFVIVALHIGGQFNETPGEYSEYMMRFFKDCGVDAVIGHHPHTIQKTELEGDKLYAYSLGGLSVSPSAIYVHHACKPEYSLIYHLYIDESTKSVAKISFSITKGTESANAFLRVLPVAQAYHFASNTEKEHIESDVTQLLKRIQVSVSDNILIKDEYIIFQQ